MTLSSLPMSLAEFDERAPATMGWVSDVVSVSSLHELALAQGCEFIGVKRDDAIDFGSGGSKIRKIDFLLASERYRYAAGWHCLGAIGSGNSVALASAAQALGKVFYAHTFWGPVSAGTLDNLSRIYSESSRITFYAGRVAMGLRNPSLLLRASYRGLPIIPPGTTSPLAMLGLVRAGLELGEQVRRGELPCPDAVYLAIGSGGTAVGLSVGLALAGLNTQIVAVSAVERILCNGRTVKRSTRELRTLLEQLGIGPSVDPVPLHLHYGELGRGYGHPTTRSIAMCELARDHSLFVEPVYTGKAMSRMLLDIEARRVTRPLLWHTARRRRQQEWKEGSWHKNLPRTLYQKLLVACPEFREHVLGGSFGDGGNH